MVNGHAGARRRRRLAPGGHGAANWACTTDGYRLSDAQAQAILDLRLHRLTGLEQDKIVDEYKSLLENIDDLLDILANPDRLCR